MNPSGNVTFLFSDIEGSTKLAQNYPGTYNSALKRHNEIVSGIIISNKGIVFEIIGDQFCASFQDPADAINAAFNIQLNLCKEKWENARIKIRIGIHKGPAEWDGKRYSGYLTLARVNRIMSAAHGGQVLISGHVLENIEINSKDFSFKDLGDRKLKDLLRSERLFQLVSDKFPSDFPPIKSIIARPNNLPLQLTNFIGRKSVMNEIKSIFSNGRLLTLTGTGGTGKTRLALHVATDLIDEFNDGVWLVELASLTEGKFIFCNAVSSFGISDTTGKSDRQVVLDYVKNKELILILDNCEHLINESANFVTEILKFAPKVKVIATSREPLLTEGEMIYNVPTLTVPKKNSLYSAESLIKFESVRLFTERASAIVKDFRLTDENSSLVASLCYELDGIPLAIELAAARIRSIPLKKISDNIKDRFRLLTGGSRTLLPKQQTLQAMIDWSYDMLTEKEKDLFKKLGIFKGGADLEAIENICSLQSEDRYEVTDQISNLVDKSLVKLNIKGNITRYELLESIRIYSEQKYKEENGSDELFEKYIKYFYELTSESKEKLSGGDQKTWLEFLNSDIDNIRNSINCLFASDPDKALEISASMGIYWSIRGFFNEGLETVSHILNEYQIKNNETKASGFLWKGFFLMHLGVHEESEKAFSTSLELYRESNTEYEIANCLNYLSILKLYKGEIEVGKKLQEECLAIRLKSGDKRGIAASLNSLGLYAYKQKEMKTSLKYLTESLELYRSLNDLRSIAANLGNLGRININLGNLKKAGSELCESLQISKDLGDKYMIAHTLESTALIFRKKGDIRNTVKLFSLSSSIFEKIGVDLSNDDMISIHKALPELKEQIGEDEFTKEWDNIRIEQESKEVDLAIRLLSDN